MNEQDQTTKSGHLREFDYITYLTYNTVQCADSTTGLYNLLTGETLSIEELTTKKCVFSHTQTQTHGYYMYAQI